MQKSINNFAFVLVNFVQDVISCDEILGFLYIHCIYDRMVSKLLNIK